MIQAPLPKTIETPKPRPANERAEASSNIKSQKPTREAKASREDEKEFATELEANLKDAENEVKPVQVSTEQALELPSSLVQPTFESSSPKVFDPSLTKDVEMMIWPKSSEAGLPVSEGEFVELAANADIESEISQALMKTPQIQGRSPSIDFAPTEIDTQLLSNEDFVAQKNLSAKKAVPNAYGMKVVPGQDQKIALENGLKETQVVKEVNGASSAGSMPVNSQEFILGLQTEKNLQSGELQSTSKIFDMNNIKSSQPTEIMNQITDYVVQAKAAKEPTVNMRVNHDELGMIDITVSKTGVNQEAILVNIGTHSIDGKNFFQQNSKELFSHLTTAGLNVADLKVETPTQTAKNEFDFGSQGGRNGQQGSEKQFGSEQNQRRHESERRQDLWKLLNKEAA
jgi:hypothetical protein